MKRYKYTEEEVLEWARVYLDNHSLKGVEKLSRVPDATICWSFHHRLWQINIDLYYKVICQLTVNSK